MEGPNNLDWRPDTEAHPFQHQDNHNQSKKFVFVLLKEKPGPDYNAELTVSSGWFKQLKNHLLHNVNVRGKSASADVKATEEFLESR